MNGTFCHSSINYSTCIQALDRYRSILENSETRDPRIAANDEELGHVAEFQKGLDRIACIIAEEDPTDRAFNPLSISTPLEDELSDLQRLATDLPGFMQSRMEVFSRNARTEYHAWMSFSILLGAAALAMIGFLMMRFRDRIIRPLEILVEGSRQVAQGNHDYRIELNTDDEVAELADALNAMTSSFQTIKSDLNEQVQTTNQGSRTQRKNGQRRISRRWCRPRNQQSAGHDRLVGRIVGNRDCRTYCNRQRRRGEDGSTHDIEEMQKYLRRIQDEAFRCKGITAGLLDFSRMGDVEKTPDQPGPGRSNP